MGHGELEYEAGLRLGSAYLSAGRFGDAEEVLRATLQPFRSNGAIHGHYRLRALLADALSGQDRGDEAMTEWQAAREGVARAMEAQTDEQQDAFRELPTVKRILDSRGVGYAAGIGHRPVGDMPSLGTSSEPPH